MGGGSRLGVALAAVLVLVSACSSPSVPRAGRASGAGTGSAESTASASSSAVPQFDHIVVVVLENHAYSELIAARDAPFLNALASSGAVLTQSYAISHPSEPNYLSLFSGSTQGLSDDSCPHSYSGANLAASLLVAGHSFVGYSEDLPATGYTGCSSGKYARKHNPWVDFPALPSTVNQPMTSFPADFTTLPTVSFVVPNLSHDMHDGSVAQGDQWLKTHLGAYASWARTRNSLLIVTADEDDSSHGNQIATIIDGAHVRPGQYATRTDHYGVLRTVLASYQLPPFGGAAKANPITTLWAA